MSWGQHHSVKSTTIHPTSIALPLTHTPSSPSHPPHSSHPHSHPPHSSHPPSLTSSPLLSPTHSHPPTLPTPLTHTLPPSPLLSPTPSHPPLTLHLPPTHLLLEHTLKQIMFEASVVNDALELCWWEGLRDGVLFTVEYTNGQLPKERGGRGRGRGRGSLIRVGVLLTTQCTTSQPHKIPPSSCDTPPSLGQQWP